jgi:hypothetical protein
MTQQEQVPPFPRHGDQLCGAASWRSSAPPSRPPQLAVVRRKSSMARSRTADLGKDAVKSPKIADRNRQRPPTSAPTPWARTRSPKDRGHHRRDRQRRGQIG